MKVSTTNDDGIFNALAQFDHVDAHCYDPNEEHSREIVSPLVKIAVPLRNLKSYNALPSPFDFRYPRDRDPTFEA